MEDVANQLPVDIPMTKPFERLVEEGPQADLNINLTHLLPEERMQVRRIRVSGKPGYGHKGGPGKLASVYYVDGDEVRAAKVFTDENRQQLERMDFGQQNILKDSLSQEIYDLVLHHLGERRRTVYSTLIVEERPDGKRWLIDRDLYEQNPGRRYTIGGSGSARLEPEADLERFFEEAPELITVAVVESWPVAGDLRQVLDFLRLASAFPCEPADADDGTGLAVRKVPPE